MATTITFEKITLNAVSVDPTDTLYVSWLFDELGSGEHESIGEGIACDISDFSRKPDVGETLNIARLDGEIHIVYDNAGAILFAPTLE